MPPSGARSRAGGFGWVVRTAGWSPSRVRRAIADVVAGVPVQVRRDDPEVVVVARADTDPGVQATCLRRLAAVCVSTDVMSPHARLGSALRATGQTLAVAESCTGGLIGHLVTQVPGASAYFLGGVVAYANAAKQVLLGVCAETLREHGAVSAPTVAEMALGARRRLGADVALATSGIAGPGGGTPTRPVGLVHVALALGGDTVRHLVLHLDGDRRTIKLLAALRALQWASDVVVARRAPSSQAPERA